MSYKLIFIIIIFVLIYIISEALTVKDVYVAENDPCQSVTVPVAGQSATIKP
jgi:hypothetical protein